MKQRQPKDTNMANTAIKYSVEQLMEMKRGDLMVLKSMVDQALIDTQEEARKNLLAEMKAMADEAGFDVHELMTETTKPKSKKNGQGMAQAKAVQHPEDPNLVYKGRGAHPKWLKDWLADGHAMDDLKMVDA